MKKPSGLKLKKTVVFYHASCSDGFGGAWAAWKKFGSSASYVPISHVDKPPAGLTGRELYFIDIVFPEGVMRRLANSNTRVTAIDHHITAEEIVKKTERFSYAVNHSGAILAWKYFHAGAKPPLLLRYVEDQDLWKFKLPYTRTISVIIELFDYDFRVWNTLAKNMEQPAKRKRYVEAGSYLLKYVMRMVHHLSGETEKVRIGNQVFWAVNSSVFRSEIGGALSESGKSPSLIWSYKDGAIRVSLRSNGKVDVAEIAKRFGGGGHRAAAGFRLDAKKKLPWKRV